MPNTGTSPSFYATSYRRFRPTEYGCYTDSENRAIPDRLGFGAAYSSNDRVYLCNRDAKAKGYTFFALQNGNECFAGSNLTQATAQGPSNACSTSVTYDAKVWNTGGPYANYIYAVV